MLTPIAYTLAIVLDLLVLFIGGRFLLVPRAAYGVPAKPDGSTAYLTVFLNSPTWNTARA